MSDEWTIPEDGGFSKAKWTPYAGRKVCGRVRTVVIRGEEVYVDGIFVGNPGVGRNLFASENAQREETVVDALGKVRFDIYNYDFQLLNAIRVLNNLRHVLFRLNVLH
jgi:hypothetical protein